MSLDVPTVEEFVAGLEVPLPENTKSGNGRANTLEGTDEADLLEGRGSGDHLDGGGGEDQLFGGGGRDSIDGGAGSDYIEDLSGANTVDGGEGDDYIVTGRGRDTIDGGYDDDVIFSGAGRDVVNGGEGEDIIFGGRGHDSLFGDDGDDHLFGGNGRDFLDGGDGDDMVFGGNGADVIHSQFGNDLIEGGRGNDWIESRSDGGEPIIAENPDGELYYPEEPLTDANDTLYGGKGADTFYFRLDIDAKAEIAAEHVLDNGKINWQDVAGENNNDHDHWVNGIGNDRIMDFKLGTDTILIEGHTTNAAVEHIDLDDDGTLESTRITLYSDQGAGGGAHNQDKLGTIMVENVQLSDDDITVNAGVFHGAHETLEDLIAYGVERYGEQYDL